MMPDLELQLETAVRAVVDRDVSVVGEAKELPNTQSVVRFIVEYDGQASTDIYGADYQAVSFICECSSRTDNGDAARFMARKLLDELPERVEVDNLIFNSRYLESGDRVEAGDDRYEVSAVFEGGLPL